MKFRAFGLTLLVMLASCLLHLVATSYFLFFELLNEPVYQFTPQFFQSFRSHIEGFNVLFELGYVCCIVAIIVVLFSSIAITFDCRAMSYGHYRGEHFHHPLFLPLI